MGRVYGCIIIFLNLFLEGCYVESLGFFGPHYDHVDDVGDAMSCQHICELVPNCEFWTYCFSNNRCWLGENSEEWTIGINPDYASGIKTCEGKK